MKKYVFIALFTMLGCSSAAAFSDIENNWYKNSIQELKDEGFINGFEDGTYKPHDTLKRAELLKIIMNVAGKTVDETNTSCFSDVSESAWYAKYVCSWVQQWITKWYEDATFRPGWTITFIEALAFSFRTFSIELEDEGVEEWYEKYISFAHRHNIVPKHSFTSHTLVSRGQAAEIISRIKKYSEGMKLNFKSTWCDVEPGLKTGSYSIDVWWKTRKYLLYVPNNVKKWEEKKLIVAFHGRTNNNEMVRDYMQLGGGKYGSTKNQTDFIVAYPEGMWTGPYSWHQYENIEFFDALITELSEKLCVNRDAVFSVWHSLGSYMSNKVSCQRWDIIRAMVWVASDGFAWKCSWPVSSLITHLSWDHLAAYSWGKRAYRLKSEINICSQEERNIDMWNLQGCSQKKSCSQWNTAIFCNKYNTYWNDQHSWPKDGTGDILEFLRNVEKYEK